MPQHQFCGKIPGHLVTPEVLRAFRTVADAGVRFWRPGGPDGNPLVPVLGPRDELIYWWSILIDDGQSPATGA